MSDQVNGIAKAPTVDEVRAWMRGFMEPVCATVINGILRSMPHIPVDESMVMLCRVFGYCIGGTLSAGDLSPILQLRARCKEAFGEGMSKVPVRALPPKASEADQDLMRKVTQGSA
jgi:hypothetical protein